MNERYPLISHQPRVQFINHLDGSRCFDECSDKHTPHHRGYTISGVSGDPVKTAVRYGHTRAPRKGRSMKSSHCFLRDKWENPQGPNLATVTVFTKFLASRVFRRRRRLCPGFGRDQDRNSLCYWLPNLRTVFAAMNLSVRCSIRTQPHWTQVHHRAEKDTILVRLGHGQEHDRTAPRKYDLIRPARRPRLRMC